MEDSGAQKKVSVGVYVVEMGTGSRWRRGIIIKRSYDKQGNSKDEGIKAQLNLTPSFRKGNRIASKKKVQKP